MHFFQENCGVTGWKLGFEEPSGVGVKSLRASFILGLTGRSECGRNVLRSSCNKLVALKTQYMFDTFQTKERSESILI